MTITIVTPWLITIVTPWLNCHELADGYLRAIEAGAPDRVIIVDNASVPPVHLPHCDSERLHRNYGFSAACNLGLGLTTSDAVCFLNNDVKLGSRDWLDAIRAELRPGVLVGAELCPGHHAPVNGRAAPYLSGWCLAGMTADLHRLGGWSTEFDEPAYYADNELSWRAKQAGFRLVAAAKTLVHLGNYTTRGMDVSEAAAGNRARFEELCRGTKMTAATIQL